jgi:acyl carrier protein
MDCKQQQQLLNLFSELLAIKDVRLEHRLREDRRADSLDIVQLFLAIEEEFSVVIPDDTAEQLKTVQDVACFIEQFERNR